MNRGESDDSAEADLALPARNPDAHAGHATNVRWLIFALCCATSFTLYLHRYTYSVVIGPVLKRDYGYSNTETQTIGSMFNWTYTLGSIPSGVACDFLGPHVFLGALIILWSLSLPGHLFLSNRAALISSRLSLGLFQAGAYPSIGKVTQIWFRPGSRTILQGWIATAFGRGGGAMASVIIGTLLMKHFQFSWQQAIVIVSLAGLLLGGAFLVLFRNSPEHDPRVNDAERALINEGRPPVSNTEAKVLPWGRALRNRSMVLSMVQLFHGAGADSFFSITLGSYFQLGWKLKLEDAGWVLSLPLLGGAAGGMVGAYLNDFLILKVGRRWARSLVGFTGSFMAALLIALVIISPTPWTAAWMLFVVKFFVDWTQPTMWGTMTDLGGKYSATVFSIVNTAGNLGGVVLPIALGALLDWTQDDQSNPQYGYLLAAVAGLYVISAVSWLAIDCTQRIEE